jgi:DNA-binding SARP family transcriptional activator/class 3 adenylate cyclase
VAALFSGTVTFLFTDIEGSTRLLTVLRDGYGQVLADHQRLLRDAFAETGGQEIDTQGDSFFVAFSRARDAVAAAVSAQRALADHPWPEGTAVKVRMGLHSSEPTVGEERYVGLGVHRAARICSAAHGGQILLSAVTRGLVEDDLPDGVTLRDLGEHRLKDLERAEPLSQLLISRLPADFPAPRTAGLVPSGIAGHEQELGEAAHVAVGSPRGELDFLILGPLEVRDGDESLPIGGPKQRAVLALLLLDAGRVVSSDRLIDVLWGERPPRTAATSLQNFISQLRKILGPDVLVTKPPGYVLRIRREQLDLNRFRALVEKARTSPPELRAEQLRDALALWRGPALEEFAFDAFSHSDVAHLDELRLAALEDRIEADLAVGLDAELIGELEAVVQAHPLRERPRAQLMLALYRAGRQAEALQVYQETRRALVEQLGLDPSPGLQQLHASIIRQETGLDAVPRSATPEDHLAAVMRAALSGRLVPVLGTDVSELATRLAQRFDYPTDNGRLLPQVAQYVAVMKGSGPLYDELHALLDTESSPTAVHRFFASLPPVLRDRGVPHQLIVTTGYDLALEQAFVDAGEEFDVVTYLAAGPNRGRFCHLAPDGSVRLIDLPNEYVDLSLEQRTVILKVHGQLDRTATREWESFVVTEDDYIDYLSRLDIASVVPVSLAARLRRSHFLFLGYTMADWNLRVILNRLWGDQPLSYRSWAVQSQPMPLEREFWRRRDVDVYELPLEEYVQGLAQHAGLEWAAVQA